MRFGFTVNGSGGSELESPVQFENMLTKMKSEGPWFAVALYPIPDDFDIHSSNPWDYAVEYIQSAGSADSMSVEVRRREGNHLRRYAVTRPGATPSPERAAIDWNGHRLTVLGHEVFTSGTAISLYRHYWMNEATLPISAELRVLDI